MGLVVQFVLGHLKMRSMIVFIFKLQLHGLGSGVIFKLEAPNKEVHHPSSVHIVVYQRLLTINSPL